MREELLQFIWWRRCYDPTNLKTTDGKPLQVLSPGQWNRGSGPDFLEASIEYGGVVWYGAVEIHIRTRDYWQHAHAYDERYDRLILHVVYQHDPEIAALSDGLFHVPTLELKPYISLELMDRYAQLQWQKRQIPCSSLLPSNANLWFKDVLPALWEERLQEKWMIFSNHLDKLKGDWNELCYSWTAYGMGQPGQGERMQQVASAISWKILLRWRHRPRLVDALWMWQAGWLHWQVDDPYWRDIQAEGRIARKMYPKLPPHPILWDFSGRRPAAFPTFRSAIFLQLYYTYPYLLDFLLQCSEVSEVEVLAGVEAENFWCFHFHPGQKSKNPHRAGPSRALLHQLLINIWIPLLLFYAQKNRKESLFRKVSHWIETLPCERNKVLQTWHVLGVKAEHARDSQSLHQLKVKHCDQFACLSCRIGINLLTIQTQQANELDSS